MTPRASNKKVPNSLVALSSAAVLAVYTAGYVRTRPAADRLAQAAVRRLPPPQAAVPVTPVAEIRTVDRPVTAPVPKARVAPAAPKVQAPIAAHVESQEPATVAEPALPAVAAPAPEPPAPVAPVPVPEIEKKPDAPPAPKWKDGTYLGWGTSRHGDIQASVVIESGRIASATIAQCLTRYSCSVIAQLPPQVAQRQSPEVDFVSGATQSANAFYYAVEDALSKAK
ncbi:MAG TPA: FMN-binding protein [Candidatus Acidoferrum sp.]|jgi:uncharacterized protein with FMN-binding domain|nr:FMN-binding protein [Candidatus Acidoferrum sp.]